jgi:hypothetical protein
VGWGGVGWGGVGWGGVTYEIRIEHGSDELVPPGEGPEYLWGGEGGVQEKATAHLVELFAQQGRQDQQVVVMNPDKVVVHAHYFHQFIGKHLYGTLAVASLEMGAVEDFPASSNVPLGLP